jgi:uncharacterized coiled-coil protein SlyX
MTIERCIECDNPTNNSRYVGDDGPFCETCFEWKGVVVEHKAIVEKLEAEVERLKEHTWEQERAAVVAMLSRMPGETPPHYLAHWIEAGKHWPEGGKG